MHHFADDTNLLYSSKPLKVINKTVNNNLKNIAYWLKGIDKLNLLFFNPKLRKLQNK